MLQLSYNVYYSHHLKQFFVAANCYQCSNQSSFKLILLTLYLHCMHYKMLRLWRKHNNCLFYKPVELVVHFFLTVRILANFYYYCSFSTLPGLGFCQFCLPVFLTILILVFLSSFFQLPYISEPVQAVFLLCTLLMCSFHFCQ